MHIGAHCTWMHIYAHFKVWTPTYTFSFSFTHHCLWSSNPKSPLFVAQSPLFMVQSQIPLESFIYGSKSYDINFGICRWPTTPHSKCLASSPHPHPKSLTKIHTRIFLCIFLCNFPCIFVCIFLWWLHRDDDGVDYTMNSNLHCTAEQYSLSELSTTHTNMYTLPPILKVL